MWLCGAAVKVFAGSYWRPIKVCGWTDEFQGTVDEDSSIPFFHWKMLAKKVYGCHRLLSCLYRNVSGEQGAGCLKGIKPNCNSLSNETSGEWAETTLRAIPKKISICIFFYAVGWIQIQLEVTKTCWKSSLKCEPFKGQKIFVFLSKSANSHNGRIVRPNGGMEWGKLAASAPSVLGKNRSTEMCFTVSWMYAEPYLHLVPVSRGSTVSVFSTEATRLLV